MRSAVVAVALLLLSFLPTGRAAAQAPEYLYLWTANADSTERDYLAVLDVTEDSVRYGGVVTTLPVPGLGNGPHHTEHEMPADRRLFANGFRSGQTFIFDLTDPARPRLAGQFGSLEGYDHPHTFDRLPNGDVLATFQMRHGPDGVATGGLVEVTPEGEPVRSSSAAAPDLESGSRVYSAAAVPALDRIVSTTTDMDASSEATSRQIQVWRLSDLALLHTVTLPDGPRGDESEFTAEPRVLGDGRTVLVSTFSCGLYLLDGLEGDAPSARLVASFPQKEDTYCAIPVVVGDFYLVTVPAWSAVVSLDVSDPAAPREVSRLVLGPDDVPHWISVSPDHRRVAITGYGTLRHRVLLARLDPGTGRLTLDERFREEGSAEPGFTLHDGIPHGAVFGRP